MAQTYTHRLFINEYNSDFVFQLSYNKIEGLYCTDESTDKMLVICGTLENLQKLAGLMFVDDLKKIQEVFPSFLLQEDADRDIEEAFKKIYNANREAILKLSLKYSERGLKVYNNPMMKVMNALFAQNI